MTTRNLPAGMSVKYHLGDGQMRSGTLVKVVDGIGYSIVPITGQRILVPAENVRGSLARQ